MANVKMFTADWCGPCKMTKPLIQEYIDNGVIEVVNVTNDTDKYKEEYGFQSIPHFYQEKGGVSHSGFINKDMFEAKFDTILLKEDDDIVYGIEIGNICPICKIGRVEDLGGCHSCVNCGAQLKCGI